MHQIQYAVKQGCVRLRNALKCMSEAIFTVMESRVAEKLPRQQSWRLLLTVGARLIIPTAGHERKHNACRADTGDCVGGYTYFSRVLQAGSQLDMMLMDKSYNHHIVTLPSPANQ